MATQPKAPEILIAIGVRLVAIALAITVIRDSFAVFAWFPSGVDILSVGLIAVIASVCVIICVLLWKFPLTIAKSIYPKHEDNPVPWSNDDIYQAGIILLGIYFAYGVISDLTYWGLFLRSIYVKHNSFSLVTPDQWASLATTIVELILCIVLILGASGIRNMIFKVRYGGTN